MNKSKAIVVFEKVAVSRKKTIAMAIYKRLRDINNTKNTQERAWKLKSLDDSLINLRINLDDKMRKHTKGYNVSRKNTILHRDNDLYKFLASMRTGSQSPGSQMNKIKKVLRKK